MSPDVFGATLLVAGISREQGLRREAKLEDHHVTVAAGEVKSATMGSRMRL